MNTIKASLVVAVACVLVAGCGSKKEEVVSLPPEQVLTGNAILAPQSVTLEAHNTAVPSNAVVVVPSEPATLELTSPTVTDKPTDKDIQQALKNAGIYNGPIDGNIGPKSKKAIREFQTQNGLNPDGKVGPRTWKKLSAHLQSAPVEAPSSEPISD